MSENRETEASKINKLILNAAINKTPIFTSFKRLCNIQGNEKMDYVDFEWKYYKFYRGSRDLTIERSSENSSPVTFSDLSMGILGKIVEKSDLVDCLKLRKVSHDLRNLVDSTEIRCEKISFKLGDTFSRIGIGNVELSYDEADNGPREVTLNRNSQKFNKYGKNHREMMIAEVSMFLKNPNLKIQNFSLWVMNNGKPSEHLDFLKSLNFQLDVRSLSCPYGGDNILQILQLMKPDRLQEIDMNTYRLTADEFNEIAETEQWKKAKKLSLDDLPEGAQADKFLQFKDIYIEQFDASGRNVTVIRDILLASAHLEWCSLGCQYEDFHDDEEDNVEYYYDEESENYIPLYEEHEDYLNFEEKIDKVMSGHPAYSSFYSSGTGRFSIPRSEEYYKFEFNEDDDSKHVYIKRIRNDESSDDED